MLYHIHQIQCLQAAIMTPEGGSWGNWGYPYIKISPYRYIL